MPDRILRIISALTLYSILKLTSVLIPSDMIDIAFLNLATDLMLFFILIEVFFAVLHTLPKILIRKHYCWECGAILHTYMDHKKLKLNGKLREKDRKIEAQRKVLEMVIDNVARGESIQAKDKRGKGANKKPGRKAASGNN